LISTCLPVFEAAYEERNLSRAARRLAMTQSAVSHSMTRLAAVFRDELFIRKTKGVEPTRVADLIYGRLRERDGRRSRRRFGDARVRSRHLRAQLLHRDLASARPLIAVRLRERLARAAPHTAIAFSTRSRPLEMDRGLREGWVDAVIDWLPPGRGRHGELVLFEDSVVAVARAGHPALKRPLSLRELRKAPFVGLRPRVGSRGSSCTGIGAWQRLKLNVVLEVSEFVEVFMVAAASDLLGLVPSSMTKFAGERFALKALRAGPKGVGADQADLDPGA
jgi:DNA-binding transcriptional LysR family regulator